jgi:secondary thiamine-phosphate synthase enzyme
MSTELIEVDTSRGRLADLTAALHEFCKGRGDGACLVFAPHATAGLALMELGSGSEEDLAVLVDRVLPLDQPYSHRHGSEGHGRDHLIPVLVSPSITIPVVEGRPMLGTWQSLVLVDTNRDNPHRHVRLTWLQG